MFSEVGFQLYIKFNFPLYKVAANPLIGSEITPAGDLGRSIDGFKELQKLVSTKKDFDVNKFLPRIPKIYRDNFSEQFDFLERISAKGFVMFPHFLYNWIQSKKVCEVSNSQKIILIDPSNENYLQHLPYNNFILSLSHPLIVQDQDFEDAYKYSQCFVSRDGDILRILAIPSEIDNFSLTENQKKSINDLLSVRKHTDPRKFSKTVDAFLPTVENWVQAIDDFSFLRVDINTGEVYKSDENFSWTKRRFSDDSQEFGMNENDLQKFMKISSANGLFALNGICKLFANYVAPENIALHDFSNVPDNPTDNQAQHDLSLDVSYEQEWYEVSVGNVTFVSMLKSKTKNTEVSIHTGREMPPHLRRQHIRRYRDENGNIVKQVLVKQTTIRADKLQMHQGIHGSVSLIK